MRSACLLAASGWLAFSPLLQAQRASPQESQADASPIVRILKRIAQSSPPSRNPFLNQRRIDMHRRQLASTSDRYGRLIVRFDLAFELLRAGRTREAIAEAESMLRQVGRDQEVPQDSPVMRSLQEMLAFAYLRAGEQRNCLMSHNSESCLLPIQGSGVHTDQRGSRAAIERFSAILQDNPSDLGSIWLLNIAYMTLGEYPKNVPPQWLIPPRTFRSDHALGRFEDIAPQLDVDHNALAGGAIVEDFDGDGYLDILASSWGLADQMRFYRNNADGSFSDRTSQAGLDGQVGGLNLVQADYDNDGDQDVLVLRGAWLGLMDPGSGNHPNSLLRNNGDGSFSDVTLRSGLLGYHPTQAAAWADFDLDGHLDLFVGNESSLDPKDGGQAQVHPCQLYRNRGDGTFEEIAAQVGLAHVGFVKAAVWGDYDNDGRPDLYLSRNGQSNLLFRNFGPTGQGGWRFADVTARAGVAEPLLSFPAWFWDFDNDGWEDLLAASFISYDEDALEAIVADYLGRSKAGFSRLYRNNRDGTFSDVTQEARFDAVLMAMGANFGDLDNDGFLDAYFGTGQPAMRTLVPNRMFRNDRGTAFQDVTTAGGFGHLQKGHAIAFADIDNDGDQDIYAVMGGAFSGDIYPNALFRNPGTPNGWVTLILEGAEATNRSAIGARIELTLDQRERGRRIHRSVGSGGSFGASPLRQEIGIGRAQSVRRLRIAWPNRARTRQEFSDLAANRIYRIRQGQGPVEVHLKRLDLGRASRGEKGPHHRH